MNTRLRFKLIAALIALSLAGLLVFQGYWLKGLYDTLYQQMETQTKEAMRMADYGEMFIRMKKTQRERGRQAMSGQDIWFYSDAKMTQHHEKDTLRNGKPDTEMHMRIDYGDMEDYPSIDSALIEYIGIIDGLGDLIQSAMHARIDSLEPIRIDNYRRLLDKELAARRIDTPHELRVIDRQRANEADSLATPWKDAARFDYPTSFLDESVVYRLYLKSPARVVLTQMAGILASSLLLLLLIVGAFVYLLRTILRQKSVEELKTDFTNNMTHELKTPISVSYAATDALLNFGEPVSEKQRKYLGIIKEQLIHLSGLVEQILALAVENRSTFRLRPERVTLGELIDSLLEQYRLKADKPVELSSSVADDITLTTDRTHLYNMLSNLLDNAIKYADKTPCRIRVSVRREERAVVIEVADNGPGISERYQRQIFDKFFRVPSGNLHNVKGYGLGLYYVHDMMSRQGGSVAVRSTPGKGSTFTLRFPTR